MRWSAMLVSLVFPGMGHTAVGRSTQGLIASVAFFVCLLVAVGRGVGAEEPILDRAFVGSLIATVVVYAICQLHLFLIGLRAALAARSGERDQWLRSAMAAVARGDDLRAEVELRRCLAIAPSDLEAHMNLGALYARRNMAGKAKRHLRRLRRLDVAGKWEWEAGQTLASLRGQEDSETAPSSEAGPAPEPQ